MPDKLTNAVITPQMYRQTWAHKLERYRLWKKYVAAGGPDFPVAYMREFLRLDMRIWALRYARARWQEVEYENRRQLSLGMA